MPFNDSGLQKVLQGKCASIAIRCCLVASACRLVIRPLVLFRGQFCLVVQFGDPQFRLVDSQLHASATTMTCLLRAIRDEAQAAQQCWNRSGRGRGQSGPVGYTLWASTFSWRTEQGRLETGFLSSQPLRFPRPLPPLQRCLTRWHVESLESRRV